MTKSLALASAAMLVCSTATAQTTMPVAPVAAVAAANYSTAVLRTGTEVPLKLSEGLTTKGKKLKVG